MTKGDALMEWGWGGESGNFSSFRSLDWQFWPFALAVALIAVLPASTAVDAATDFCLSGFHSHIN